MKAIKFQIKSKHSGRIFNVVVDMNKMIFEYFIEELGRALKPGEMIFGIADAFREAVKKEYDGKECIIKKEADKFGADITAIIDGEKVDYEILSVFFDGTPANGKYILNMHSKIKNLKRIQADKEEREWIKNAKISQEYGY